MTVELKIVQCQYTLHKGVSKTINEERISKFRLTLNVSSSRVRSNDGRNVFDNHSLS
jgi:hypothetical protein